MRPMTPGDVGFAIAEIGKTVEVTKTLQPAGMVPYECQKLATALLQVWDVTDSDATVDELLAELARVAGGPLGRPNPAQVWRLLNRKIEVAQVFLDEYRRQLARAAATIDDNETGD